MKIKTIKIDPDHLLVLPTPYYANTEPARLQKQTLHLYPPSINVFLFFKHGDDKLDHNGIISANHSLKQTITIYIDIVNLVEVIYVYMI